jgi:hypothetical protein
MSMIKLICSLLEGQRPVEGSNKGSFVDALSGSWDVRMLEVRFGRETYPK